MARWIKEEFEGVVTVLFVAIAAGLPWNVTAAAPGDLGKLYAIRWWVGETKYFTAISAFNGWEWSWDSIMLQSSVGVFPGYAAWGVGSAIFAIILGLSIALVFKEETVRAHLPIRIVAGWLLIGSGASYLFANFYLATYGIPGTYVPIGGGFQLLFGAVLLTNRYRADGLVGVESADQSA